MIDFKLIETNHKSCDLELLFKEICAKLEYKEIISSSKAVVSGLIDREKIVPTLFENGVGIPHTSNESIKETTLVLVTSREGIRYNDGRLARLVIFLLTPPNSGENHLNLMSSLSSVLLSKESVEKIINTDETSAIKELFVTNDTKESVSSNEIVLAITACTTGIAHTYIAASALEKAAKELNIAIHVERQGANGIENKIPKDIIGNAEGIILATDVEIEGVDRFQGIPSIKTSVADPIENSHELIKNIINKEFEESINNEIKVEKETEGGLITSALLNGFSKIIPLITLAVVLLGVSQLLDKWQLSSYFELISNGMLIISLLIFCGEITRSIGSKNSYPLGILSGMLFISSESIDIYQSHIFAATITALCVGLIYRELNAKLEFPQNMVSLKVHLLIPTIIAVPLIFFSSMVITPLVTSSGLIVLLNSMVLQFILTVLVIVGICYDYGGRVNKMANLTAVGLAFSGIIPLTACNLAIVIPPIGMAILKLLMKNKGTFDDSQYLTTKNLFVSGMLAMSEGVKPFIKNYRSIIWPINILGTGLGVLVATKLGAVANYPLPAFWGLVFVENVPAYIIGLLSGALVIGVASYISIKIKQGVKSYENSSLSSSNTLGS